MSSENKNILRIMVDCTRGRMDAIRASATSQATADSLNALCHDALDCAEDMWNICNTIDEVMDSTIDKVINSSNQLMDDAVEQVLKARKAYDDLFSDFAELFIREPAVAYQLCLDQLERKVRMELSEKELGEDPNGVDWRFQITWKTRFILIKEILRDGLEALHLLPVRNKEVRKAIREMRFRKRPDCFDVSDQDDRAS